MGEDWGGGDRRLDTEKQEHWTNFTVSAVHWRAGAKRQMSKGTERKNSSTSKETPGGCPGTPTVTFILRIHPPQRLKRFRPTCSAPYDS